MKDLPKNLARAGSRRVELGIVVALAAATAATRRMGRAGPC
jgi:hypothetical protein